MFLQMLCLGTVNLAKLLKGFAACVEVVGDICLYQRADCCEGARVWQLLAVH